MAPKPYVKNAADPKQVKSAKKRELWDQKEELNDVKHLMQTPQFRRFIWRLLIICNVFDEVWHPSALIHKLAGMQHVGQLTMKTIKQADMEKFFLMWRENDDQSPEDNDDDGKHKSGSTAD